MTGVRRSWASWLTALLAAALALPLGMAASRVLYEALFPRALWLGRPIPVVLLACLSAVAGWQVWRLLVSALSSDQGREKAPALGQLQPRIAGWLALTPLLPLLLNLIFLFSPTVNLLLSRFLLFSSLWLAALFATALLVRDNSWRWLGYLFILLLLVPVYLLTMGRTVGTADTFEFQVVVPKLGIVHPTGYPLYLLLSKPFTYLPFLSVAWRVNLATVIFGLLAACLLCALLFRIGRRPLPAVLAAVLFGLSPTFWSQAVEAEVYTLHALIVAAALLLMGEIGDWRLKADGGSKASGEPRLSAQGPAPARSRLHASALALLLAFVLGLGLTNHLTTLVLLPPAFLTLFLAYRAGRFSQPVGGRPPALFARRLPLGLILAFLLPLLLYAYLPLRWQAVNGEPMGLARFVDWVIGGRFQGALQLDAWLRDPTRYEIVGRLLIGEWRPAWLMLVELLGLAWLFARQWRYGLVLLITWLGYVFYALNYYVPDLSVFLIPAHLVSAVFWGIGLIALLDLAARFVGPRPSLPFVQSALLLIAFGPGLIAAAQLTWSQVDRSDDSGKVRWAQAVLDLPLDPAAAILADSDKFPALYYLQQAEGLRTDLSITLLPDEAAYRNELATRLASGQTVYLARFLPGLEGSYHLRSAGPLTEVGQAPLVDLTPGVTTSSLSFGPIKLLGYELEPTSPYAAGQTAVTLYWQTVEPIDEVYYVYLRWFGPSGASSMAGQYPVNNNYPTVAWEPGEIVPDFHSLSRPIVQDDQEIALQVALGPPFADPDTLEWQTIVEQRLEPPESLEQAVPLRLEVGPLLVDGIGSRDQLRPSTLLPVSLSGWGATPDRLVFSLVPVGVDDAGLPPTGRSNEDEPSGERFIYTTSLAADLPPASYNLFGGYPGQDALCGWLAPRTPRCVLAQVLLSGAPLPEGAINFDDLIALVDVDLATTELQPGGQLPLTLTWQSLAPIEENYTVFIQVVDEQDQIVGQIDSWPLQGTYPTSQWQPGEVIHDPYTIQLDQDLAPGRYRVYLGWYLLETLRRLPILSEEGLPMDDKVVLPGLLAKSD